MFAVCMMLLHACRGESIVDKTEDQGMRFHRRCQ